MSYRHHLYCFFRPYLIIINSAFLAPDMENKVLWLLGILVAWGEGCGRQSNPFLELRASSWETGVWGTVWWVVLLCPQMVGSAALILTLEPEITVNLQSEFQHQSKNLYIICMV